MTNCKGIDNLIPSGNDFYLAIALKSRSLVDGEVVETPFDFEAADTYNARIYGILDGATLSTMVGLKDGSADTVIIDAKGVPLIRAIGVEVTGEVDGRAFRAAEKGFLSIVEFNGEAKVVFTPVTGGQQANLVMTLTFLPSAAVVGKNAYEIWKEEPGNQDKTLADFIYFLGHGESAYEIAVRYGYTGTEAEYNMLYFDAVDVANTAGQNAQQAADTANQMAAQAQDAAELADAATTNANNAATAAAATVDAAIGNMENTLNAAIAAQDAEIDEQFANQTSLINQKQMEIGAVPSDLTPTIGSTNWVTSGGVYADTPSITTNTSEADLEIIDESTNVLVRFANGHIRTKHFNSQRIQLETSENNNADFTISDDVGNTILACKNGNIRTKYFNSAQVSLNDYLTSKFAGKSIAIIGDSISTYRGWLPSDVNGFTGTDYATYYPAGDVDSATKTWWYQVAKNLGISVSKIANTSWSGGTVCGDSTSTTYGKPAVSTKRITDVAIRGFIPDIIIVFISCNDWYQCGLSGYNITLGNWAITDAVPTEGVINQFRSAYALMLSKIENTYPNSRIFCCTILDDYRRDAVADDPSDNAWPPNDAAGITTTEWNNNIREIAEAFACDVIDMHNCGITYYNIQNYAVDAGLHPNAAGHSMMARKVTSELMSKY